MFSEKYDFPWPPYTLLYEYTTVHSCKPLLSVAELPTFTGINSAALNIFKTSIHAMVLLISFRNIPISGIARSIGVSISKVMVYCAKWSPESCTICTKEEFMIKLTTE